MSLKIPQSLFPLTTYDLNYVRHHTRIIMTQDHSYLNSFTGNEVRTDYQNLFPYFHQGEVPDVPPPMVNNAFITIPAALTSTPTFTDLAKAKQAGNRGEIEKWAADFISQPAQPGDLTCYIASVAQLPVWSYPLVNLRLEHTPSHEQAEALGDIVNVDQQKVTQTELSQLTQSLWWSVLALVIQIDYEYAWLDQLLSLLRKIHIGLRYNQAQQKNQPADDTLLSFWWHASVLLPDAIFPLPAQSDATQTPQSIQPPQSPAATATPLTGSARYYALGILNQFRYRLVGYEAGELQKVETVLPGETRTHVSREVTHTHQHEHHQDTDRQGHDTQQHQLDQDLSTYVQQVMAKKQQETAFNQYKTGYNPGNQSDTSGGWTITDTPLSTGVDKHEDFIQQVLAESKASAVKDVNQRREQQSILQREQTSTHEFSNQTQNIINGFYFWLNKRYKVTSSSSYNRLLIEIICPVESSDLGDFAGLKELVNLKPPQTLAECGVNDFHAIQPDCSATPAANSKGKTKTKTPEPAMCPDYLSLAVQFEVSDLPQPPAATCVRSLTQSSDKMATTLMMPVPDGYQATKVTVGLSAAEGYQYQVNVAGQVRTSASGTWTFPAKPGADTPPQCGDIPVSVLATPPAASSETSPALPVQYTIQVSAECTCLPSIFARWQFDVYQALQAGYQKQLDTYLQRRKEAEKLLQRAATPMTRSLMKNYVIHQGMMALYHQAMDKIGDDLSYPHEPMPFEQYASSVLDWENLCIALYNGSPADPDTLKPTAELVAALDAPLYLKDFLTATQARLYIPVQENHVLRFLYFLDTGKIWHGEEQYTPVNRHSEAITADYKRFNLPRSEQDNRGHDWYITLPTTMAVLGDDHQRDLEDYLDHER
ncbi:hypothetical protein VA7868_00444 [Vibrio aerogenes CECT 7868]|uniref:Uncharacterized protein n=1 Tax=Vibrio aerogenes CECT 7868 TaxID=1216006 RepID=A0A1M5VMC8_9VIBR|nr:hypothetical protein [Vibrio aerogenes]SHH76416.1 hypothetical protein VA7868_00444 [Vibrio aerogenes CECT 7868]